MRMINGQLERIYYHLKALSSVCSQTLLDDELRGLETATHLKMADLLTRPLALIIAGKGKTEGQTSD